MWHCSKVASPDKSDRCEILNQSVKQIKKSDSHLTDVPRAAKMMIVKTMQNEAREAQWWLVTRLSKRTGSCLMVPLMNE